MSIVHANRQASVDEIAAEMDRRGAVIEKLEAERNLFKGKYRALLRLISRTRDKLVHVTDHIEDEGDRRYFGSTNDADALRDIYDDMESWVWDAIDKVNRMQSDPYADIREQRARAEKAEKRVAGLESALKAAAAQLAHVHDDSFKQAGGFGLITSDGRDFSCFELNKCETAAREARAALKEQADA